MREDWYKNGNLMSRENYVDGKLHGKYEFFHENGELMYLCTYKNEKLDGEYIKFDENGYIVAREHYSADINSDGK